MLSGLVSLGLAGGCERSQASAPSARPEVPVLVEAAASRTVPIAIAGLGNVVPISTVQVRSRVDALLERALIREGQDVRQGELMFQLDPRPFRLALQRAQADLARDRAQLQNAESEQRRYASLFEQKFVSAEEYEQRQSALAALRGTLQADQSAIQSAQLDLDYTKIGAPISGRTGSLQVTAGNLVKANADPPLTVIRQLSPIDVAFSVPADRLEEIRRYSGGGTLQVQATPHGADAASRTGQLTFIENTIDVATGTIALKASFANQDRSLWPGQLVDVELRLTELPNATLIPARAVQSGQRGDRVFVVDATGSAGVRSVVLGPRIGDAVVVERGVSPGERVVVDGQLNLVPGAQVTIRTPPEGSGAEPASSPRGQP